MPQGQTNDEYTDLVRKKVSDYQTKEDLDTLRSTGLSCGIENLLESELNNLNRNIKTTERLLSLNEELDPIEDRGVINLFCNARNKKRKVVHLVDINEIEGDRVLRDLRAALSVRQQLTKHQRMFNEIFIQSNLYNIYGKDFATNELRIKAENNVEEIDPFSLVCCPRRWGKTFVTASFVASALCSMRNITITVFSPALRQSYFFVDRVRETLSLLEKAGHKFTYGENNKQKLTIIRDGSVCTLNALPAHENTTRGVAANIIICEEAAAMPRHFFGAIIMPLLTVNNTALLAISTIQDEDNYYSQLIEMKNLDRTGPMFNTFKFFNTCDKCRAIGKSASCKHLNSERPHWMSDSRKDIVKHMYNQIGLGSLGEQETSGVVTSIHRTAFPGHVVARMFAEHSLCTTAEITWAPQIVYTAIDPTGGGNSDLAVVSGMWYNARFIFVGLESMSNIKCTDDYEPYLEQHYDKIRAIPQLRGVMFNTFIEQNMGWQTREIRKFLKANVQGISFPDEMGLTISQTTLASTSKGRKKKNSGYTNHEVKEAMYHEFKDHLEMNRMAFLENGVTAFHPSPDEAGITAHRATKRMLQSQLMNYYIQTTVPANPAFQEVKITWGGKTAGGGKDDLAVTAQLAVFWSSIVEINKSHGFV